MSHLTRLLTFGVLVSTSGGCFLAMMSGSKEAASAGLIGCAAENVVISNLVEDLKSSTWIATCHGHKYSCSTVENGGLFQAKTTQNSCSPVDPRPRSAPVAGSQTPAKQALAATVERAFDEQYGPHVRGRFQLSQSFSLTLLGAPGRHAGKLLAILEGTSSTPAASQCQTLSALVNAVPSQPLKQVVSSASPRVHIEVSFAAASFEPLAQRFPAFALQACEKVWKFDDAQLLELQKFLVIYSDMSAAPDAEPVPANNTTL